MPTVIPERAASGEADHTIARSVPSGASATGRPARRASIRRSTAIGNVSGLTYRMTRSMDCRRLWERERARRNTESQVIHKCMRHISSVTIMSPHCCYFIYLTILRNAPSICPMLRLRSCITRLLVFPAALSSLSAQSHATDLITGARAQLSAGHLDSAAVLLRTALDTAAHPTQDDRLNALVLSAILEFYRGNDSLTRAAFHQALVISPSLSLPILSQLDSHLGEIF